MSPTPSPSLSLQVFDFQDQPVRLLPRDGEPWFVAADVCRVLDIANPRDAIKGLDADEKMTVANTDGHSGQRGGAQFFNLISESGLYALVFKSRKPEARAFRKWVTAEVLPALRRGGTYALPGVGGEALEGEVEREALLDFTQREMAGYSLGAQMEFGLLVRRYAKAMGVMVKLAAHPVGGQVLTFPVGLLAQVREFYLQRKGLPAHPLADFDQLIAAAAQERADGSFFGTEYLHSLAVSLGLFRGLEGGVTPMQIGRMIRTQTGRPLPSGLRVHAARTRHERGCRIWRGTSLTKPD